MRFSKIIPSQHIAQHIAREMAKNLKMGITEFLREAGVGRATMSRYYLKEKAADKGVYLKLMEAYNRLKAAKR